MRSGRLIVVLVLSLGLAGSVTAQPALDSVVEILRKLEGDPAGQEAFRKELEAYGQGLQKELDTAAAELEKLEGALGDAEAKGKSVAARIEAIKRTRAALEALAGTPLGTPAPIPVDHAAAEHFENVVRPILAARCFGCHGQEKQKGGLRLDSHAAMLQGGEGGAVVVPGDAAKSTMVDAIAYTGKIKMPPDAKLPQAEVDALTKWVADGAHWPDYGKDAPQPTAKATSGIDFEKGRQWWAFKPVQKPAPPAVRDASWVKTPVDAFVLSGIEGAGLMPNAPAEKRTLLRRVTFDLVGLPPTPEEVEAFVNDPAPDAYAKVVDRLLASPHYGERWARHWLDVMRYTDSFDSRGGPATDPMEIYKYRDWVVRAFNDDMPFDRFVKYQIAGDIIADRLPTYDPEGIIATGALAIGNWPQGDADKQKMVSDIVDDQVDLVCRGFMGVTMGCARCHDHKFDPFATRDYYALAGMFFSSHILPGPGQKTEGSPILYIPLMAKDAYAKLEARKARIAEIDKQVAEALSGRQVAYAKSRVGETARYMMAAQEFAAQPAPRDAAAFAASKGLDAEALANWVNYLGLGEFRLMTAFSRGIGGVPALASLAGGPDGPSLTLNEGPEPAQHINIKFTPRSVAVHPAPTTPVAVAWKSPISGAVTFAATIADIDAGCGDGAGWRIEKRAPGPEQLAAGAFENAGKSEVPEGAPVPVAAGDYLVLTVLPKSSHSCDSTGLTFTISEMGGEGRRWDLTEDLLRAPLAAGSNPFPDARGVPGVWFAIDAADAAPATPDSPLAAWQAALHAKDLAAMEAAAKAYESAVAQQVAALGQTPAPDPKTLPLAAEFLSSKGPFFTSNPPYTDAAEDPLPKLREELAQLRAEPIPTVPMANGIQEGGTPNTEHAGIADVRIHQRGDYNRLGDVVPRGMPVVLAGDTQPAVGAGSGRFELAEFVASPKNPLTARVFVNRIWQHHFGEGIVRTPGNFGTRGEAPTDPALLDFLAASFVESGWSVKAMHRMILLSATYQQGSAPSPEALAKDPENRLWSRMNRNRLEAEILRDAMLAVSGKLDLTIGGEAFRELSTPRRTLYFRTVRSDRTTYNMLFDAADPTSIIDKRNNATIAPQALFLMNNPFVKTQATALAERVPHAEPMDATVQRLYALLFARAARAEELEVARDLLAQFAAEGKDPATSWVGYCHLLLATNEFAYVD